MKAFSVTYFLRKSKAENKAPVGKLFARITVDKKRIDFSLNRKIEFENWDASIARPRGRKDSDKELVKYISTVEEAFFRIERELIQESIPITPKNLLQAYNELKSGESEKKRKTLFEVFDLHQKQLVELNKIGAIVMPTVTRYVTTKKYLLEYMIEKCAKVDIYLNDLQLSFVLEFDHWLRTNKNCAHNTTIKYIKNLRKIIKLSVDYGWLPVDPFTSYKGKAKIVNRDFLDMSELRKITDLKINMPRLDRTRKLFLFSCYTGLAYIDMAGITRADIHTDNDGVKWIFKERKKTKVVSRICLLPAAEEIMNEYQNHPQVIKTRALLPVLSNQRLNSYLKEISDLAGIRKNLTFHVARHTFATTVTLGNGVSLESVSAQLGHTNLRQTQHYAKMVDSRISREMLGLHKIFK